MAQRFKSSDLKEMIRSIVKQEIKEVVASTINEVLSERYLKQLAESVAVSRPRGVSGLEQMGDDATEEPPPHPLANSRDWPFEKHAMKHDDFVPANQQGDDDYDTDYRKRGEDPTSIFFEGTRSLKEIEDNAPSEDELTNQVSSAPIPGSKKLNEQKQIWTTLAGVKKKDNGPQVDAADKAQFEEARIKRMRADLDRKA